MEQIPQKAAARRWIRFGADYTGLSILLFLGLNLGTGYLLRLSLKLFPDWTKASFFGSEIILFIAVKMVPYALTIGLPFWLMTKLMGTPICPFARRDRVDKMTVVLLSLAGLGAFVLANLLTEPIVMTWSGFGLPIPNTSSSQNGTVLSLILNLINVAVLPAILEEMAFRGFLLERLRPFGDRFALFVSALFFGLAHGNIVQIPFAFVLGLCFGFIVIKTGNIWLTVWLHFLNNGISAVLDYLNILFPDYGASIHMTLFMLMLMAGLVATGVLCLTKKHLLSPPSDLPSPLTAKEQRAAFFLSPAIICSFVFLAERFIRGVLKG